MEKWRVLIVDGDGSVATRALAALRESGVVIEPTRCTDAASFDAGLDSRPDVVLARFHPTGFGAAEALQHIQRRGLDVPVLVIMEGNLGPESDPGSLIVSNGAAELISAASLWRLRSSIPRAMERRRLLHDARRAKARFRLAFDNVPVGIAISRDAGDLISVNPTALRIMGYETQEQATRALGKLDTLNSMYVDQDARRRFVKRLKSDGLVRDFEVQWQPPGGKILDVSLTARLVAEQSGKGHLVITIIDDVTERKHTATALRASEARLSRLVASAMDGIVVVDERQRVVLMNPAAEQMFGCERDHCLGLSLERYIPEALLHLHRQQGEPGPQQGLPVSRIRKVLARRTDGSEFPVEISVSQLITPEGTFYTAFLRDITDRVQQEQKIDRLSRIQRMQGGVNAAIVRMPDRKAVLQEACRVAVEYGKVQFALIALLEEPTRELRSVVWYGTWDDPGHFTRTVINVDDPQRKGHLVRAIRTGKTIIDNDVTTSAATSPAAALAVRQGYRSTIVLPLFVESRAVGAIALWTAEAGFFTEDEVRILEEMSADVSFALEWFHKAERVNYLLYDALTDLPSRNSFQERLAQYLRVEAHSLVPVALMDIERFRLVNETLGRPAGDELLRQVAQRLRGLAQSAQAEHVQEIARVGMNSFGVVLRGVRDADQATISLQDMLRLVFEQPFEIQGSELRVRARCGIALYPSDGADAEQLLRNAEAALGNAKHSADVFLFYAPEMNVHAADVLALEYRLRRAIELHQFVLHYQTKVNVIDRRIVGVEALIRWQDPENGLIPPARFIPILEETGMIFEVGRWALEQAIEDYKRWVTRGLNAPRIAVNISPLQLRHRDFLGDIQRLVQRHMDAAIGLDLEITESVIMEDYEHNIYTLCAIRDLGINIAIDDFGTGYSSLSYLAKLPVATLKIDRSFIVDMTRTPQSFAIVSTIISLAHSLNLRVVAEGVETEEQAKFLRVLNCDEIQGFLIGRPMPVEQLENLLAGNVMPMVM